MRFDGKTVVVVGGSSGVGKSAAGKFAEQGANVVMLGLRPDEGDTFAKHLTDRGLSAQFWQCDWTSMEQLERIAKATAEQFGQIDVLYNHAGTILVKPFLETSDGEWTEIMETNLMGMVRSIRCFLPHMLGSADASIVNMASISGLSASAMEAAYCVSKGACVQLTRAIAAEFRDRGVRCNAVCPGFIRTDHGNHELRELQALGAIKGIEDITTLQGRMSEPDEIADAVLFLASHDSRFINGEMLVVDNAAMATT
ncbi:MAG: SDR family oxidoreductase [Pseudoruegeria sp.]